MRNQRKPRLAIGLVRQSVGQKRWQASPGLARRRPQLRRDGSEWRACAGWRNGTEGGSDSSRVYHSREQLASKTEASGRRDHRMRRWCRYIRTSTTGVPGTEFAYSMISRSAVTDKWRGNPERRAGFDIATHSPGLAHPVITVRLLRVRARACRVPVRARMPHQHRSRVVRRERF